MKRKESSIKGITLIELLVVVGAIGALVFLGVPSVKALLRSLETEAGTRSMINAALSSARAIALKEQRYAGLRFQKLYDDDLLEADQYMIFVLDAQVYDKANLERRDFFAVEGQQPIKVPESTLILDISDIGSDADFGAPATLIDISTFSIIFTPSGHLIASEIRARNRDNELTDVSSDDIFNTKANVLSGRAMFCQDDYPEEGYWQEVSRTSVLICDAERFTTAYRAGTPWSTYLRDLMDTRRFVNRYTGRLIGELRN